MAVEPITSPEHETPGNRFTRYLYVGKEYPVYHSGSWSAVTNIALEKLPSLEELASSPETELLPLEKIKSALSLGLIQQPETFIFALAASARQQKSEKLRRGAYEYVSQHCKNPEHFLLFICFASRLSKQQLIPRHGYGHGWRSAVNDWYLSQGSKDLANSVTRYKSRHGWTHKDIIKLSHLSTKGSPPDVQAVLKYIVLGLEKTKLEFSNESKTQEVLEFIERVEDFRQCDDPVRAAALIRTHHYTLEHVNPGLMKSPDVWEALIDTMDFPLIVLNLQRIHNAGLLTAGSQLTDKIITAFLNKDQVLKSKIRPSELLLAAKNYENPEGVPMPVKRRIGRKNKLKHKRISRPDKKVIEAIYSALNTSFSNVEGTGLKYLITVSTGGWRKSCQVGQIEGNIPWVVEAACILALGLLRAEEKVTVSTFTGTEGLNARPVHIEKSATFQETVERMKARSTGPPNLGKPMLWAAHHRRKYDVFVNVVDKMREKYDFTGRAMDLYKKKMNLPGTRLVNWVVGSTSTYMEGRNVSDVLTVCGFDVHIPRIIEAFARRQF
ncbi:60 kDa SS-A/Ro ribonucleoprotein [Fopius arisanus]|uniref:60 kDa SS-A/Ro ribonucleoprotein n=1 Tax=Fopius arisanus TaxID=64838 RepID=A0A9R1SYQ3_9HYME|nr:PREDICTED: 60 kDa SS-A/Ro ribonucleoprotein-like [Fopius arisanus]XP_011299478.1 PREDICTED: 60 kDa SS-A/Ro ribonucleoprotein-like [Fopius arisanus]